MDRIKSILKSFYLEHETIINSTLILIGLLFLCSVFIEANKSNTGFIVFFYSFGFILTNANNCYQINNKLLYYSTTLGITRKSLHNSEFINSMINLMYLVLGLFLYNLFVWFYSRFLVVSSIHFLVFLDIILLYFLFSLISLVMSHFNIRFNYYILLMYFLVFIYYLVIIYFKIITIFVSITLLIAAVVFFFICHRLSKKDIVNNEF